MSHTYFFSDLMYFHNIISPYFVVIIFNGRPRESLYLNWITNITILSTTTSNNCSHLQGQAAANALLTGFGTHKQSIYTNLYCCLWFREKFCARNGFRENKHMYIYIILALCVEFDINIKCIYYRVSVFVYLNQTLYSWRASHWSNGVIFNAGWQVV